MSAAPTDLSNYYLITGREGTGTHERYEIEELQSKHPLQFTLFILAFLALQGRGEAFAQLRVHPAAQFPELAGIHGLPYQEWRGDTRNKGDFDREDPKDTQPIPSRFGGYCNHGSVVFPTWHRPYVMAIEQVIGDIAVQLATYMSERDPDEAQQWKQAAQALRFPFWDWAAEKVSKDGVPSVLTDEKISIYMEKNVQQEVDNPLAYFVFKTIPEGFEDIAINSSKPDITAYFSKWMRTYRHAKSIPNPSGSGNAQLNAEFKKKAACVRANVGRLFSFDDDGVPSLVWDEFSNHTTESLHDSEYYNAGSLEGIHDLIHDLIGGNGHMADPDYAGFDPIFWLHHCNVDRLLAFWEYVYPEYFMGKGYPSGGRTRPFTQSRGTYNQVYNAQLTDNAGLAPFRTEKGVYWTSNDAHFLDGKYYSYPAVNGVQIGKDIDNEERGECRRKLREHYGFVIGPRAKASQLAFPRGVSLYHSPTIQIPRHHDMVKDYRNFVIVVRANEFAFNGPYSIDVYHVPTQVQEERTYIGSVAIFARPDHSACKGCSMRRDAGSTVRGIVPIPLDLVLQVAGPGSPDVTEESILAELKKTLRGIIVDRDGNEVGEAFGGPEGVVDEKDALSRTVSPHATLVSSAAAISRRTGTLKWFDWKNHGKVFEGGHRAWRSL